nr:tripartite tricarboxylate transporter substrate binding protein [Roseomonas acroporae]
MLARPALSQGRFPDRPIRVIVPWPAGGASDATMRVLGEQAGKRLGQPIVVENKPGASGTLGAQQLANATRPDGYTLGQMPTSIFRIPVMSARPAYDPVNDFTWIIRLLGYSFGVVVRGDAPWKTFQEFLAYARAHPGEVTYGTPGVATLDVTMERIALEAGGIRWVHVPFRGAADNLQSLLSGNTTCAAESSGWADLVQDGRLRLLVTWGEQRMKRFPDVPTLREVGIDIVAPSPIGLAGPKGMDPAVVRILHDAFKEALFDPATLAVAERYDMPVMYADSEGYATFAREYYEQDSAMVRRMGLRL